MADLPSILGGMAQGFLDFGKSAVDLFGTGGASIADLIESARTGKVTTRNSDDFRKWLYDTNDVKDAAAKGLGTALNGVQTVSDYIPGIGAVTRNPLFNAGQGALGGLADEFKMYGKDYDLGRAGQRAAVGAGGALASTGLADALKGSGNALLKSGTAQGLARGAVGGAIGAGGYTAIDGGSLGDVANSALQGAGMGAALGGTMGALQDFRPAKTYDVALTDEEKAARIANAKNMLANEQNPERIAELNNQIKDLGGTLADADMAVNSARLTPEQEAYFKDSVIRDENGNLMPLYHGSNSKFTVFDSSKGGQSNKTARVGHWFTPSEEGARNFANSVWYGDESEPTVYSTYLNVKNPKIYEAVDNSAQIKALNNEMDNLARQLDGMRRGSDDFNATYKKYNDLAKQIDNLSYGDPYEQFRSDIYAMEGKTPYQANVGGLGMMMDDENAAAQKYVQSLRDQGYDGIIIRGTDYDTGTLGGTNDQYVVFDSNQIKDINNLSPTDNPDIMMSKLAPGEADLARALANQDLSINNAKVAPGQLGLFDDMPTQTPKTGTRQTSLFDQPQEGLDYYGDDIEAPATTPTNPYAPVDGQVTQAMRDRASEIIDNLALKRQIPDNELFNRIDPATLPKGQQKIGEFLDQAYSKGLTHGDITDMMRETVSSEFDKRLGKTPNKEKLISFIFGNADETAKKEMMDKELGLYIAPETVSEGTLSSMARHKISSEIYGDNLSALVAGDRTLRGGYTGALDSVLSERLGIAPGNTYKKTGAYDTGGSYGRYQEYRSSPNKNNIMVRTALDNEDAVNTMAHERLHSFQTEAKKLYDQDRYSPEVKDAYDELAKDLKSAKAYRTGDEIKKRYGRDVAYWRHHDEQEARMLQQYLDAKGYTGSNHHNENRYLGLEYDDAKITPAFDKFFDKLRDMSKRGIALPALTALFGGGALMASQQKDKEEVR